MRSRSHRASHKLRDLCGARLRCFYTFRQWGNWYAVPDAFVAKARSIPGLTRTPKPPPGLAPCIDW